MTIPLGSKPPPLPIEDIPESKNYDGSIIMLCYGEGGSGKTEFGATIGEDGIILEVGGGEMTLSNPGLRSRVSKLPKLVHLKEEMDPTTGFFKKAEAWNKFTDFCDWFVDQDTYKTLCVDDASHLTVFARNRGMEANQELGIGAPILKSQSQGFPIIEVADFGKEIGIMMWFFLTHFPTFRARKKNFILLAHERHIYTKPVNDKGHVIISAQAVLSKVLPGFTGEKLPDEIPKFFDFMWRFECVNGKVFRCKTLTNQNYVCKTRWDGVFPEEIKNPNFQKIVATLKSGGTYKP